MSLLIQDYPDLADRGATQTDLDRWIQELELRNNASKRFPIWMTIEVGTHATVDALVQALESAGSRISDWARALLPQVTISPREGLKIVTPTVRELGFTAEWTPIRDIHARGLELGYTLCPSDLALSLRLQYWDQSMGEQIFMAMKALKHPGGRLNLFCVERSSGGRFVNGGRGHPEDRYHLGYRFAFVVPQA